MAVELQGCRSACAAFPSNLQNEYLQSDIEFIVGERQLIACEFGRVELKLDRACLSVEGTKLAKRLARLALDGGQLKPNLLNRPREVLDAACFVLNLMSEVILTE